MLVIYLAVQRNQGLVSNYQTTPGLLYGAPGATGMQNYFLKIRGHFGQSLFDQLVTEFAQQSNLYVDEIKVDEWHIYGSSRLGVYEANRTISKRVARDLNNDNQITNNEYVIETPEEVMYLYSSYQLERGAKRYELANHLGNVLTVISDKKTANFTGITFTHFTAERISATDYSPFGATLAGRSWNGGEYRYGFNGQEKDNEINGDGNSVNFKYRIENTRLGRFFSVDPLSDEYPELTPYQVASLSPVWMKELEGLEGVPYTNPMQAIWVGFGQGIIGIADWFDKTFSWGYERTTTTPVSTTTKGPVTIENGTETKTTTETTPQIGGTLRSIRDAGKPVSTDNLPASTKTNSSTSVSGYNQVSVKKGKTTIITKTTVSETEAEVETAITADVKVKKVPLTVKQSASKSTNGNTQVKTEVSKSETTTKSKVKASVSITNSGKKSEVKLSAGEETKEGKSEVSTEKFIKIKTGG